MTTKPYKAYKVFESDNIWRVGLFEAKLIRCTYYHSYNINIEKNWEYHILKYIKQMSHKISNYQYDVVKI